MLACLDLRLRPVDAEDLRPARVERAEVRVERRVSRPILIPGASQVLANLVVQAAACSRERRCARWRRRAAGSQNRRLAHPVRDTAPKSIDGTSDRPPRRASWIVHLAAHQLLDLGVGLPQVGDLRPQALLGGADRRAEILRGQDTSRAILRSHSRILAPKRASNWWA
jgi:type IV secretory pathway TrbD component